MYYCDEVCGNRYWYGAAPIPIPSDIATLKHSIFFAVLSRYHLHALHFTHTHHSNVFASLSVISAVLFSSYQNRTTRTKHLSSIFRNRTEHKPNRTGGSHFACIVFFPLKQSTSRKSSFFKDGA